MFGRKSKDAALLQRQTGEVEGMPERMSLMEAIEYRHSVRKYTEEPLSRSQFQELQEAITRYDEEGGLHMQLITNEPKAFSTFKAKYGRFQGVQDYIAMTGPKSRDLEERCGYYGEKLVLLAQQLELNTCWVGGTYTKVDRSYDIGPGEKLVAVIAVGHGADQGSRRRSKKFEDVSQTDRPAPDWFRRGVQAALMAPTAINQQKFRFYLEGETVKVKAGFGPFCKVDKGIVICHFEIGSGRQLWNK
jgi:nitroreductase